MNWEQGGSLSVPNSTTQSCLILIPDLVEAQCYFDKVQEHYSWFVFIGDIRIAGGDCDTEEEAKDYAESEIIRFKDGLVDECLSQSVDSIREAA